MTERPDIDTGLVSRLIAAQQPQWAALPVRPVDHDGWDNRSLRLGDDLVVRLPSAAGYVPQVAKEVEWLPRLAPALRVPIPEIVAVGEPGEGYPFPWTVRRWIDGIPVVSVPDHDRTALARDVGAFLAEFRAALPDGPAPGARRPQRRSRCPARPVRRRGRRRDRLPR